MKTTGPKQPVTPVPIRECPQCGYKTHIRNEDDEFDLIVQDNAEKALEIDDAKQRIAELEQQRDELLAALERTEIFVRRTYIYQEGKPDRHDTLEDIKAAIAKVKP